MCQVLLRGIICLYTIITLFLIFQFNESWRLLLDWTTEIEQTLDTHKEIAVSHEEIKLQLVEQKVQRSISRTILTCRGIEYFI